MKLTAFFCLLVGTASASVLKSGRQSNITVEELEHLDGKLYDSINYGIICPGTKWCGDGDTADNFDDLGKFINTDKCCRTHDFCDDSIPAGESKYGLVNEGHFTRSHCKCDLTLYDCLHNTECSVPSGIVGIAYFNVVGAACFDLKPPATCLEYEGKRCVKYEFDDAQPSEWQWFDVPKWSRKD